MPHWDHIVAYEEKRPEVIDRLRAGYPRFAIHPCVRKLWQQTESRLARPGEGAMVLPSARAAERCVAFLKEQDITARAEDAGAGLFAVLFPEAFRANAQKFWQHYGDVVSSRRAEAALAGSGAPSKSGVQYRAELRARVASFAGVPDPDSVFLYSSGMGAMTGAWRALLAHRPGRKTVQLGFPYVDGLKMQTVSGPGAHFFPIPDETAYQAIEAMAKEGSIAGVFCETPGNPQLRTPDVPRLSAILRPHDIPLVVDDTVASFYNVDPFPHADLVASSLTKLVSGVGDVMAGSVVVSPHSPLRDALLAHIRAEHEDLLWEGDAEALLHNSADYPGRAVQINANALAVAEYLRAHPEVDTLWYPSVVDRAHYDAIRRPQGGYGGLLSLVLKHPEGRSQRFYDALALTKGPSLGTNFSLVCPYTLLAHYDELDWAEGLGISRYLIRWSVGLEPADVLIAKFDEALRAAG